MAEEFSGVLFKQPAYALVIGVSKYEHGVDLPPEGNLELKPHQFPNLKLAAKDAQDFAQFLKLNGFLQDNVRTLFGQEATENAIRKEFRKLGVDCKRCEEEHPLVIVYFAGHGWANEENEHYLIPWDARRDDLYVTAISNRDFGQILGDLKTNRLAVFLDACHSGAMGIQGSRGAAEHDYDFRRGLGEGEGRYLIASCKPGQKSYEPRLKNEAEMVDANGIFTGHLLQLLKCETNDIEDEEIDILRLYHVLKDRVKEAVHEQYGKDVLQEPLLKAEGDGLILAINRRVKLRKATIADETKNDRRDYLELLRGFNWIEGTDLKRTIITTLESYVDDERIDTAFEDFYGVFDEQFGQESFDEADLKRTCALLYKAYNSARRRASRSIKNESSLRKTMEESQAQKPKAVDPFGKLESKPLMDAALNTPISSAKPVQRQAATWQMSAEDCHYILEEISSHAKYIRQTDTLQEMLDQPISEADFSKKVLELARASKEDVDLKTLLTDVADRFVKRYPKRLSDLRIEGRLR